MNINLKKSLILIGIRSAGKTTLIIYQYSNHPYITLDDLDYLSLAEEDSKVVFEELVDKIILIFLKQKKGRK